MILDEDVFENVYILPQKVVDKAINYLENSNVISDLSFYV